MAHHDAPAPTEGHGAAHRGLRLVFLFSIAVFLAVPAIPHGLKPAREGSPSPDSGDPLTFRTIAFAEEVVRVGAIPVETYPAFLIARGSAMAVERLRSQGIEVDLLPDWSTIRLRAGPLETRGLAPQSILWTPDARGTSVALVHIDAPMKEEWRREWTSRGLDILRYFPVNAFLVRGTPDALRDLDTFPHVDWVGPFEPDWKTRSEDREAQGTVDVRILMLPGARPEEVLAWLSRQGVPRGERNGTGPGIVGSFGAEDFQWIRASVPASIVPLLSTLPQVEFIEKVRPVLPLNAETNWVLQTNRLVTANSTRDLRYWWNGLDGRGQTVAIADMGVDFDHDQFRQSAGSITLGDIYNVTDPSRRKITRYLNMGVLTGQVTWLGGGGRWDPWSIQDSDHSPAGLDCTFGHGTAVASVLTGDDNWRAGGGGPNDGLAFGAQLYVQDIGTVGPDRSQPAGCFGDEDVIQYLPEDFTDLFGPPGLVYNDPAAPVRIHSNSWGSDVNEYDIQARMVDAFVWSHPDLIVFFAAGNMGSGAATVTSPGTAKNIVTVGGASNPDNVLIGNQNDLSGISSRGPANDGRMKPTILAIFDGDSAMSDGNSASGGGDPDDHWQGTSYATPAAAAAAAIVRQYFLDGWYPAARVVPGNVRTPSAALVRAMLIASGVQITGSGIVVRTGQDVWPNNEQGFGRVQLSNVLPMAAAGDTFRTQVVDETEGILTGDDADYAFRVTGGRTLKLVLTWTDPPAAVGAAKALVNDLDLVVTAPNGTLYRGNNFGTFAEGQSVPGTTVDTTNVEEAVILKSPGTGDWTVRVVGSNVPAGPQPFALVATGDLDPQYGRVLLGRASYRPDEAIQIQVDDPNASAIQVRVTSDFEPSPEVISLTRGGPDEIWRGSIPLALGAPSSDGVLQVRHRDTIRVEYNDPSPAHTARATARVDAEGPTISDVRADNPEATSARIRWRTDESATSGLWYGTAPTNLSLFAEDLALRTAHDLALRDLLPDTLYYFDVASRDRHGQGTRDTNIGRHYRFRTDAFGDVLLVLGGASLPVARESSWKLALDGKGWTWALWRTEDVGPPPLAVLHAHRAVLWQVGLEQYPPFGAAERDLIKQYLDRGGRLLVTSHDTAWALADVTSQFYSAEGAAWVRGVMHASLLCDPRDARQLRGIAGDPISGAYTGGLTYAAHRSGGAVDELLLQAAGGTASPVWTDAGVSPAACGNQPVGLRWVSSGSNGTAGSGVWGGTPSRLLYFAFEITGVDAVARPEILDNAIRWLVSGSTTALERDHPNVNLTSPNGGLFSTRIIPITWTAAASDGTIASFTLDHSADGGQTWTQIAMLSGSARSYPWDVTALPNGDRYLVRIVARDGGTPFLTGRDGSDSLFSIRRSGGDGVGPSVWSGSVRIAPNPPQAGGAVTFGATADDSPWGGSPIAGAEAFVRSGEPDADESGTGTPMNPADGGFNASVEPLTWSGSLAVAPGGSCVWIHAYDASGNWGPYESSCFVLISAGPDVTPPATARLTSARLVNAGADIELVWNRAFDDGLYDGTRRYRVLRSTSPQLPGSPASGDIIATGAASYSFVDVGRGTADSSDYFYRIEGVDAANNNAVSRIFAAKVRIAVGLGLNLLGVPVDAADRSLASLAGTLTWITAWTYDACSTGFPWTSGTPAEAAAFLVPPGRGLWVNATAPGTLLAVGLVPATAYVELCPGWNLASLPGFAVGVTVAMVKAMTGADTILGFDPTDPYHTRVLGDGELLRTGAGFWIHVSRAVTWSVAGS